MLAGVTDGRNEGRGRLQKESMSEGWIDRQIEWDQIKKEKRVKERNENEKERLKSEKKKDRWKEAKEDMNNSHYSSYHQYVDVNGQIIISIA